MKRGTQFAVDTFGGNGSVRILIGSETCPCALGESDITAELLEGTDRFRNGTSAQVIVDGEAIKAINGGMIPAAQTQLFVLAGENKTRWQIEGVRYSETAGGAVILDLSSRPDAVAASDVITPQVSPW